MKRPERCDYPEPEKERGHEGLLEFEIHPLLGEKLPQGDQVKGFKPGGPVKREDPGKRQDGAACDVDRELHRGVFLLLAPPDPDQGVHRDHGHLVEEVQEKKVQRGENAVDRGHEKEVKDEILFHALPDPERNKSAARGDKRKEENEREPDAVQPHLIADPEAREPLPAKHKMEIPEGLLEEEKKRTKKPEEEIIKQIRSQFILEAVAQKEKIEVTPKELQNRLTQLAKLYARPLQEVVEHYKKNNLFPQLASQIMIEKTIDFIIEKAKLED